jgi:hypothetical protein
VFTPVLAEHSKSFSLVEAASVGVDRTQRNFEPMRKQVELWRQSDLTDAIAIAVGHLRTTKSRNDQSNRTPCCRCWVTSPLWLACIVVVFSEDSGVLPPAAIQPQFFANSYTLLSKTVCGPELPGFGKKSAAQCQRSQSAPIFSDTSFLATRAIP